MPAKRVSIFQVAQAAGVSHQTVSRVINESPNVSEATRAKVLKVIDELGYRPSGAARALATKRSRTIALIAGGISYYGPLSTIASVEATARKHGLHVSISIMNEAEYTEQAFTQVAHACIDHGADAFVFVAPTDAMVLAALQVKVDVPRVILTSAEGSVDVRPWLAKDDKLAVLGIDQRGAMEQVIAYLQELGHSRVLYMAGPQEWRDAAARKRAWIDGVSATGAKAAISGAKPIETKLMQVDDWSAQSAYSVMSIYLDQHKPWATAMVTANDQQAFGVMRALHEHGFRLPDDMSVIGFDDMPVSDNAIVPLTTVRPNFTKLGVEAMAVLLRMLDMAPASRHTDSGVRAQFDASGESAMQVEQQATHNIELFDAPLVKRDSVCPVQ